MLIYWSLLNMDFLLPRASESLPNQSWTNGGGPRGHIGLWHEGERHESTIISVMNTCIFYNLYTIQLHSDLPAQLLLFIYTASHPAQGLVSAELQWHPSLKKHIRSPWSPAMTKDVRWGQYKPIIHGFGVLNWQSLDGRSWKVGRSSASCTKLHRSK